MAATSRHLNRFVFKLRISPLVLRFKRSTMHLDNIDSSYQSHTICIINPPDHKLMFRAASFRRFRATPISYWRKHTVVDLAFVAGTSDLIFSVFSKISLLFPPRASLKTFPHQDFRQRTRRNPKPLKNRRQRSGNESCSGWGPRCPRILWPSSRWGLLQKQPLGRIIRWPLSKSKPCPLGVDPGEGGFRGLKMLPRIVVFFFWENPNLSPSQFN